MQRFRGRCGSGLSTQAVPALCRCTGRAEDGRISEFVSILALDPPIVVGLSFGGALVLEFFRRHRSQVRGLFLAGAYAGWARIIAAGNCSVATTPEP